MTAGTFTQLESRTWAAIQHWTKLCITGHWFHIQARGVYHKLRPKTWKIVAQTCKEQNAQEQIAAVAASVSRGGACTRAKTFSVPHCLPSANS